MRVVLDTNVLVAAFVARGVCADVFERVIADHELMLSPHLLGEFDRVMSKKLRFEPSHVDRAVVLLRRMGLFVEPAPLANRVCRDPDDDSVLALARDGRAKCLVTGDDDLLTLELFEGIPIVTPREFLTLRVRPNNSR